FRDHEDTSWSIWLEPTGNTRTRTERAPFRAWQMLHPLGGTLDGDFDPAILRPALRRIVASNWPCVAEALGRNARGRDALGNQKIYHLGGSPRRQHQIVGNALLLQRRSDR